jgi:signal transduction histidine kinase/CheY-like chemotaxis protein
VPSAPNSGFRLQAPSRRLGRYLLALSIVVAATLLRLAADPLIHNQIPYFIYVASVVVATWFCGVDGGILSTVTAAFAGNYFFVPVRYEFIPHGEDWIAMGMFSAVAFGLVWLVGRWRAAEAANREQAEELKRTDRLKDEFLATLSHELRTPLNAVVGWADMLRRGSLHEEAARRAVESIYRNAQAQSELINDVLDVSRIISGKVRIEPRPVDVPALVRSATESVRPAAQAKDVTILTEFSEVPVPVSGDPTRLQQVFWNLLSNAVKFTPTGGQVRVSLRSVGADMRVQVADTGAGISAEFLPHVFERFRQRDSSSTRKHGGLGLGLAIVRHLVELHGGSAKAESAGEGRGATFTVTLPAQRIEDRRQGAGAGHAARRVSAVEPVQDDLPTLCGLRLLVVDDQDDAREVASSVLRHHGAAVAVAGSAVQALDQFERFRPDVLLIDLAMPEMDGYALIERIRKAGQRGAAVPAIALTAYARVEDERRALASGFQLHIAKPVDSHTLIRAIAGLRRVEQDKTASS